MNKRLTAIVLIPVIAGIGLLIAGIVAQIQLCVYIGIGVLFGGSFLVAVIVTVVVMVKAFKGERSVSESVLGKDAVKKIEEPEDEYDADDVDYQYDEDDDDDEEEVKSVNASAASDERKKEHEQIERINSTYGYANKMANADHQISHVKKAYKSSSRGEKVGGCLFVIAFIGCAITGMILLSMGYTLAGGIVFGCSFAIIIGSLIVVKIKERMSLSTKYDPADYDRKKGTVKSCSMSSSGSVNGRMTSITYKVQLDVEGKLMTAYSRDYYNTDEVLPVLVHKNGKKVKISDEYEPLSSKEIKKTEKTLAEREKNLRTFEKEVEARRAFYASQAARAAEESDEEEDEATDEDERDSVIDKVFGLGDNDEQDTEEISNEAEAEADDTVENFEPTETETEQPSTVQPEHAPISKHPGPNVGYKGIKKK